jgi:hypothetical protein
MSMNLPSHLHTTLLAGVARTPLTKDFGLTGGAESLQNSLNDAATETSLWQAIAVHDIWQRAGFIPANADALPAAEADERTCPRAAEQTLSLLLRGLHPNLLESWLQQAQSHGFRLPHTHLPAMLDLGVQKASLRAALIPLLDRRGSWLVAQNLVWAERYGVAGEDTDSQWNLGNQAERAHALRVMRARDPANALAALQADWTNESPEDRAIFLPCLEVNLSLDDEAFLENALDDKRKEVRTQAQTLLAALPDSQLVMRCIERLAPLMAYKKKLLIGAQMEVTLPEACDKAMTRDGIGIQAQPKLGEKAGWLRDLISRVPPAHWSHSWSITPTDVIALMGKQEFSLALLGGVIEASMRGVQLASSADNVEWYCALLCELVFGKIKLDAPVNLMTVFGSLPRASQEDLVQRWLADSDSRWDANNNIVDWIRQAANAASAPWPTSISHQIITRMQSGMLASPENHWRLRSALKDLAGVLDVGTTDYFDANWPTADWQYWPQWRTNIDDFLATLRFRHTMQRSFMETSA